ncbi:hypothetical protein V8C35DRAFT_276466 [Trichoderma chlorosporum]
MSSDNTTPPIDRYAAESRRLRTMSTPFLNDEYMDGPPRFRSRDLKNPRLRRCSFDPETLIFEDRVGGGADGYVWKVKFGDKGPFVLKIFWDQMPPLEIGAYYSMQRECLNAAVIQMMGASVAKGPVPVHEHPMGKKEAMENYFSFCEESHADRVPLDVSTDIPPEGILFISEVPRMTKCYGWLKLHTHMLEDLPDSLQATHKEAQKIRKLIGNRINCIGVVYELVEDGENDVAAVEDVDNFLWRAGFAYTIVPHPRNWKSGVLVDHTEIVHARGYGWDEDDYMNRSAEQILTEEGDMQDFDHDPLSS